ncbi:MAG: DUF2065 domain-containing protein [Alphaproteobacteria bacterium]|nr:DUF2065 domain-containing protein [Alphaproteobacteria bacterium]
MTEDHQLTYALALAIGAYMLAAGLGGIADRSRWEAILAELTDRPGLSFIAGIVTFALGVTIILIHNDWSGLLAGFVSLVGWVAALEGLVLIAFPKPLYDLANKLVQPSLMSAFMALTVALGALLILLGLSGAMGAG